MRAAALLLFLMAGAAAACEPPTADYFGPVERYGHKVLGDTPEWSALRLGDSTVTLDEDRIFEDITPRVVDIGGDCRFEAIVVESGATDGAQLAVYAEDRGMLRKIAATPPIGRAFRWLSPVGTGDFNEDGALDVALIRMPHILGSLEIWTFAPGGITLKATAEGLTNHRIGDDFVVGGVRSCGQGEEIVTADVGWNRIMVTRIEDDGVSTRPVSERADAEAFNNAMSCG